MRKDLSEFLVPGKKVFFIGVGGVGMSALAQILKSRGLEVAGSDAKASKMTCRLQEAGIKVFIGHQAVNVDGMDLIVNSSAITRENPEMLRAEEFKIPVFHRAEVLSYLMNNAISIAVTGTHGKTTCSAFVSFLVRAAGYKPSCLVGGDIRNFKSNVVVGDSHLFVAEVDESDRSQLFYEPDFALLTNLEAEHLDIYKDLADLKQSFREFVYQVKKTGSVVYCMDDPNLKEIVSQVGDAASTVSYGFSPTADYTAKDVVLNGFSSTYTLVEQGKTIGEVNLSIPGRHNVLNSLGVIAVLRRFGLGFDQMIPHLREFNGAGRRLEIKLKRDGLVVIDDYAHHPTEVRASLEAIRELGMFTTAVFQPHRFSRTLFLAKDFSSAFRYADRVIITDIYSAGEKNSNQVAGDLIYQAVKSSGHPDVQLVHRPDVIQYLTQHRMDNEAIAFLGAGDISELAEEFSGFYQTASSVCHCSFFRKNI